MAMDPGSTGQTEGDSSTQLRRQTAGADLITVCRAILAPGSGPYLGALGFSAAEIEHAPEIASLLLAQESMLSLVYSAVGVGRLIGGMSDALTEPGQFLALNALLDVAERYSVGHHARLQQYR
jgi:hypothetical protein